MAELLEAFSREYKRKIEERMKGIVSDLNTPENLRSAMNYSLEAGGKRLRPLLVLAVLRAFGKNPLIGLDTACAIEMIHTYSLIHDDLPSMDDDDLRRGKPTNHKVYGEATAILAGDGLLTLAFGVIANQEQARQNPAVALELVAELSKAAGAEGMVGGQVADMEGEMRNLSLSELEYIHVHKTGKLLSYSILAGAILAGADDWEKEHLQTYAHHLGLAFQIRDDILDIEGSESKIGKPVGSDETNHKSTYPSLLSMEGAKEKLGFHVNMANEALGNTNFQAGILAEMLELVAKRDH
ncbi:farnesyl-diphosphate synthase [Bacillus sp. FJAT-27916]|uniref:polyprenyl synthetase family protein n=1 Tax=Bacillaceae TaxID=186817 RepID=UPI000671645E|nr:farnesyl diphosphate synthase [Bacillus sp. FJAT-27916]KMY43817.1 farnesyl-diphosphate synthase [Bacillus sp. FJAT-27916]